MSQETLPATGSGAPGEQEVSAVRTELDEQRRFGSASSPSSPPTLRRRSPPATIHGCRSSAC